MRDTHQYTKNSVTRLKSKDSKSDAIGQFSVKQADRGCAAESGCFVFW
jgi:hypothetical protein